MNKIKLYDQIKQLLTEKPELRNSDKKLIWKAWSVYGYTKESLNSCIYYGEFMSAPSTESIRRARQLIQARHPELKSSKEVQEAKNTKEATKGTWVYREPVQEVLA